MADPEDMGLMKEMKLMQEMMLSDGRHMLKPLNATTWFLVGLAPGCGFVDLRHILADTPLAALVWAETYLAVQAYEDRLEALAPLTNLNFHATRAEELPGGSYFLAGELGGTVYRYITKSPDWMPEMLPPELSEEEALVEARKRAQA